jgi:hypothetical protein
MKMREMRKFAICLLMVPALTAVAAPEQYVLRSQGLYCLAKYKQPIEEIADASNDRLLKRAVDAAIMSGECINSGIDVPSLVDNLSREQTPRGTLYYCYVRREEHERLCSVAPSIATLTQLRAERTGDFKVVADSDTILVAKCLEGGLIYVEKGAQWRRKSAIFFGIEDPVERTIPADKESAARDGCKGLDF